MTWHAALVTLEQAVIWATTGGLIARILIRHPLRKLAAFLVVHAIQQAAIEDKLDTKTDGGLTDLLDAIQQASPAPRTGK